MPPPNILFILIDDMGWRDLGCYGSTFYETPVIDRLAADGMLFTDAYAACPVCSPTRASLLTGKYPANVGVTDWIDWGHRIHPTRGRLIDAPYIDHLPATEHTLAAALGAGGYQTWHVGKWHLGGPDYYPEAHGFDVYVGGNEWGCPCGPTGYFAPWALPNLPGDDLPPGTFLDDHLTNRAIELIRRRDPARPFFLNLWYYLVHTPIQAAAALIEKYQRKSTELGLDRLEPFREGEPFPTEHKAHLRVLRRLVQSDPVYAAMIETLDRNVARVLDTLREAGIDRDTIVIFTSDNGGLATAEGSPTCNAPLAEGKGWMYEGGTREPLIVRWPGVTSGGARCAVPVTSPDLYPTLLEAAGLPMLPDQHTDGISLAPVLRGGAAAEREALYWHYPHYANQGGTPGSSILQGDWKLIEFFEGDRLELYHLQEDPGERRNLADREPRHVRALHGLLREWRRAANARIPEPNPDWTPPPHPAAQPTI